MDTLKGAINILTDKTDPSNPVYKTLYPKTTAAQVEGFSDAVKDLVGDTISVSGTAGSRKTIIGSLQADAITTSTGGAISATVTNATTATTATNDVNSRALTGYISSVASVSGSANKINVKTGAQVNSSAAGTTITIDNVEHAQKDMNSRNITGYINSVSSVSGAANQIVVKTGAQVNDNAAGTTITINNVANATAATNDNANQAITSTYIKNVAVNGTNLVLTKGNNTTVSGGTLPSTGITADVNVTQTFLEINEEDELGNEEETVEYPIIFKNNANTTTETAGVKFTNDISIDPYSKTITANTFKGNLDGSATNVTGLIDVSHGGTGLTASPSMLVNLGSESATNILTDAPRPGVSGVLSVAHGGTGNTVGSVKAAEQLTTARTIDGVSFNGSANITHFAVCNTAAATAAKTVTDNAINFTTVPGASLKVLFTDDNSASDPTLNINETGAKNIKFANANVDASVITAGSILELVYYQDAYHITGRTAAGSGGNITITAPDQPDIETYSGSQWTPFNDFLETWAKYNETTQTRDTRFITIDGTYEATNAGTYTAIFQPTLSYTWADTLARLPKTYTWSIAKAAGTLTLGAASINLIHGESSTINASVNYGSTILINGSTNAFSNSYFTASYVYTNSSTQYLSITATSTSGNTTLTISAPDDNNYTTPTSQTFVVNVVAPGYGIQYKTSGGHVRGTNWVNVDSQGTEMTIEINERYLLDAWS